MIPDNPSPELSADNTEKASGLSAGTAEKDIFDRQFIVAALAIGVGYALILVVFSHVLNPAAEGVAGVALTSLALGIFKKFETLRFKKVATDEERTFEVPRIRFSRLVLATILCFCLSYVVPLIISFSYLIWRLQSVSLTSQNVFSTIFNMGKDMGRYEDTHKLYYFALIGCVCIANFLFGSICGRLAPRRSAYFYAVVASLLTQVFPIMMIGVVWVFMQLLSIAKPLPSYSFDDGIYSALYVAMAFCGSYFTSLRREKREHLAGAVVGRSHRKTKKLAAAKKGGAHPANSKQPKT
jgi:hypothetical protein